MKIVSFMAMALLTVSSLSNASTEKLPFIGKKVFAFRGGNALENAIIIKKNGQTVIKEVGTKGSSILYKGKYRNPFSIEHGNYYYLIKGNQVEMLDKNKNLMKNCEDLENSICRAELN